MKVITNEPLIKRNKKIGQIATISSLVILAGGLYLSFQNNQQLITYSLIALVVGFILSQVGIYFGNRWGRSPRPDETIASSLKGLDDKYTLFNYTSPVPHLLMGPSGLWILIPYHQSGDITYEKGRWRQKGGNIYMKIFAQDSIGRPDLEASTQLEEVKKTLSKKLPEDQVPPLQPALVFTNQKATVASNDAPIPAVSAEKLKDFIRKKPKENAISTEKLLVLEQALLKSS